MYIVYIYIYMHICMYMSYVLRLLYSPEVKGWCGILSMVRTHSFAKLCRELVEVAGVDNLTFRLNRECRNMLVLFGDTGKENGNYNLTC